MKTKCIESEQPPSPLFASDGYSLDHTIMQSNGREFQLVGIRAKNYKGSRLERLWLGISALCQALFATVTWRSVSDTVREDWHTAWTGKRLTAIYHRPLSITPVKISTDCDDLSSGRAIPLPPTVSSNASHSTDTLAEGMKNAYPPPLPERLPSPLSVVPSILPTAKGDTSPSGPSDQILSRPNNLSFGLFCAVERIKAQHSQYHRQLEPDDMESTAAFTPLQRAETPKSQVNKEGRADPLLVSFLHMSVDEQMEVQFASLNKLEKAYTANRSETNKNKLQSCLDAILSHENLHEFLSTHFVQRGDFFTTLTAEGRVPIDWEKKDPTIQKVILDLFFEWAPDAPLAKFIGHEVCSKVKEEQFRYPSLVKLFFEELTDLQAERLASLPIIESLLRAMCEIEHPRLLACLYATQPNAPIWDDIRFAVSSYSELIRLLTNVWLFDTLALLRTSSDADSLAENLKDLFNTFKMPARDHDTVEDFAWLFLKAASSLNVRQIQAVAYALDGAPLFRKKNYDTTFMQTLLSLELSNLQEQGLSDPDAMIAPLLKEWVSIKTTSTRGGQHDSLVFRDLKMRRKEHVKAFVEGVKDSPEPYRTLYLSLLIRNQDETRRHRVSSEEIMGVFSSFGFDYDNYSFLSRSAFFKASCTSTRGDLERLRDLDSEEKLVAFLVPHKNRKECHLRALVGGIVVSKKLTLKPCVDELLIQNQLEAHGFIFTRFNQPIPIGEFLEASD